MDERSALLVDGNNLLYRCAYAVDSGRPWDEVEGRDYRPAYLFFKTLVEAFARHGSPAPVVVWDPETGRRFLARRRRDPSYKANRDAEAEHEMMRDFHREVAQQRAALKDALALAGCWQAVASKGWEADDVIATLADRLSSRGRSALVLTNDRDLFPLIALDGVRVLGLGARKHASSGELYEMRDRAWFADKYPGITPAQWSEYRALTGDPSDGVKGVNGIGDVWARRILAEHPTAAGAARAASRATGVFAKSKKVREAMSKADPDLVENTARLLDLNHAAPFEWLTRNPDRRGLIRAFKHMRFRSFLGGTLKRNLTELIDVVAA